VSNLFFGEHWDAPIVECAIKVETPTGKVCYDCGEPVVDGDRGFVRAMSRLVGGEEVATVEAIHAECDLRETMGHMVGVCSCTDYEPNRATARLVWERTGELRGAPL
jgi:hypothetical protein